MSALLRARRPSPLAGASLLLAALLATLLTLLILLTV
jgi:hypothetical protein